MAMVMTAADVVEVLELLEGARIEAWVDGGWGVDALLGEQTREHDDLDLTVPAGSVPAARAFLEAAGFATLRDWLPVALALRDPSGREVDLHPLAPSRDGGGDQAQPKGPPFHYGSPAGRFAASRRRRSCAPTSATHRPPRTSATCGCSSSASGSNRRPPTPDGPAAVDQAARSPATTRSSLRARL
jgi:hypothetical protein